MRVLLVAPPLVGHVVPLVALARTLRDRGHTVAWVADPRVLAVLAPDEKVDHPTTGTVATACSTDRPDRLRGFAALRHLWEGVLEPLADETVPVTAEAARVFAPDVVVTDQQAFAGALVSEREGLPWLTSASTSGELSAYGPLDAAVREWVTGRQGALRARHGQGLGADLRFSPWCTLVPTAPELAGPLTAPPGAGPVFAVGLPAADPTPPTTTEIDDLLAPDAPVVVVSMGTVNRSVAAGFLDRAQHALAEHPDLQGVVVDPRLSAPRASGQGVVVVPHLPRLALLDRAAAVLCHGGHNTVVEALTHAVPLVVAPIRDDQPTIAAQVTAAGVGRRLRLDRATPSAISAALDDVTGDEEVAVATRWVREGLERAARENPPSDLVEAVATGRLQRSPAHVGR